MKKITFSILALLFTSLLGGETKKPNVVIIFIDDMGYGDVGFNGATGPKTPNLDRMAEEGMICHNAHVTSTVCTPSRYTFLTGRYASSSHSNTFLD